MRKNKMMILLFSVLFILSGCSSSNVPLLDDKINPDDIDRIQVVLAMGNPDYGADSKIITDRGEIQSMVEAFNYASLGEQATRDDVPPSFNSMYLFFSDDLLIHQFYFNGNYTGLIHLNTTWHFVSYVDRTPFQLYQESIAPVIVVDLDFNEMERP